MMKAKRARNDNFGDAFAKSIEDFVKNDNGSAAKRILAAGQHIYYAERDTPEGLLVKEYPDGRRELVRYSRAGDEVIRKL